MKKTYVTTVPNHIGAFLSASRLLAALDVNITRVSYNKAVDSHTIFIEAEGSRQQLAQADEQLAAICAAAARKKASCCSNSSCAMSPAG